MEGEKGKRLMITGERLRKRDFWLVFLVFVSQDESDLKLFMLRGRNSFLKRLR